MDSHVVRKIEDGPMFFIDRHFIHEVTSPVAFRFKRKRHPVLYPERTFATDHNTPQYNQHLPVEDPLSATNYEH
jgi:3-isopropylmalate/(R)-2-methylmalate dehydratase large subunit